SGTPARAFHVPQRTVRLFSFHGSQARSVAARSEASDRARLQESRRSGRDRNREGARTLHRRRPLHLRPRSASRRGRVRNSRRVPGPRHRHSAARTSEPYRRCKRDRAVRSRRAWRQPPNAGGVRAQRFREPSLFGFGRRTSLLLDQQNVEKVNFFGQSHQSRGGHSMSLVEFAIEGEIAIVTINRPKASNAVDQPTAAALAGALRRFDADGALSVAILTGAGGTFCAGADLKAVATDPGNRVTENGDGPMGCTRMMLSKPVIAAVEGFAVAGGIELALWCDLRVAARDATFGVYCRRFGVPLVDGGTIRLPRLIGMSRAMDMILTGRGVSGEE